jgi:hypothetical protein
MTTIRVIRNNKNPGFLKEAGVFIYIHTLTALQTAPFVKFNVTTVHLSVIHGNIFLNSPAVRLIKDLHRYLPFLSPDLIYGVSFRFTSPGNRHI